MISILKYGETWRKQWRYETNRNWQVSCPGFYLLFCYTILMWCVEFTDLICWLLKLPQANIAAKTVGTVLAVILLISLRRPEAVTKKISLMFAVGSVILAGFFAVKSIRPDFSYDTYSYHLISQIPGFADNLNFHVIPGRFQMFGFRLGDRMFYPFRIALGYRMGTLFNAGVMLVIYRQVTAFFEQFMKELQNRRMNGSTDSSKIRKIVRNVLGNPALIALLVVCRKELLQESGTYMVELLALPFFLEMIFLLLRKTEENRTAKEAFLFCLYGGIFFCLKMTNIVYLAPLILLYLWKIRKSVTPKLFFSCLMAGIIPVSIYLIYNWIAMKNPVYPYYNTIFASPYYPEADFKDKRWGPNGIKEIFLWFIYMIRYPDYHLSEMPSFYNWDLLSCYFFMAGIPFFAFCFKKYKEYREEFVLILLTVGSYFMWAATTGHIRYFMGGLILLGMIAGCCYLRLLNSGKTVLIAAGCVCFLFPFAGRAEYGFRSVWNGEEWALRNGFRAEYERNLPWVFKDRDFYPQEIKDKVDLMYLTWGGFGGVARLIGEDVPVINRSSITFELASMQDVLIERAERFMREKKGVYDLFQQGTDQFAQYMENLKQTGYRADELIKLENGVSGFAAFNMTKLALADGEENIWYRAVYEEPETEKEAELSEDSESNELLEKNETSEQKEAVIQKTSDFYTMEATVGDPDWEFMYFPFEIVVTATDGTHTKEAARIPVEAVQYRKEKFRLDLTGLSKNVTLTFQNTQPFKTGIILNPKFRPES